MTYIEEKVKEFEDKYSADYKGCEGSSSLVEHTGFLIGALSQYKEYLMHQVAIEKYPRDATNVTPESRLMMTAWNDALDYALSKMQKL